jgi:hypothetical protein
MKQKDVNSMLNNLEVPDPGNIKHQQELKIPLFSYKKSSRTGLWLLVLPLVFMAAVMLKYELGVFSTFLDMVESFFTAIDKNRYLHLLSPVIFLGLPSLAMIINLLSFTHYAVDKEKRELFITVKYRPLNIIIFLLSFAVLAIFCLYLMMENN